MFGIGRDRSNKPLFALEIAVQRAAGETPICTAISSVAASLPAQPGSLTHDRLLDQEMQCKKLDGAKAIGGTTSLTKRYSSWVY